MQESWFCANCKSMNRASADYCYRCHAPRAQATMAVYTERMPGTVLTPGLDEEHRAVAWELMTRNAYTPAWRLGYAAASLLCLAALAMIAAVVFLAGLVIRNRSIDLPSSSFGGLSPYAAMALVVVVVLVIAAVVHSAFLGLTAMNAPALGSGSPRFDPLRSALWWVESLLWAIRAGLAFIGPPFLLVFAMMIGGVIFGAIGGVVWFMCAFWLLGDPITNLAKPGRLLKDLHERLAVPGSSDSRVVTLWAAAWGTARGVDYAAAALIYLLVVFIAVVDVFGYYFGFGFAAAPADQQALAFGLMAGLVGLVQITADVIALFLLARITLDLSDRQKGREKWVLSGLYEPAPNTLAPGSAAGVPTQVPGTNVPAPAAPAPAPLAQNPQAGPAPWRPPATLPSATPPSATPPSGVASPPDATPSSPAGPPATPAAPAYDGPALSAGNPPATPPAPAPIWAASLTGSPASTSPAGPRPASWPSPLSASAPPTPPASAWQRLTQMTGAPQSFTGQTPSAQNPPQASGADSAQPDVPPADRPVIEPSSNWPQRRFTDIGGQRPELPPAEPPARDSDTQE